MSTDEGHTTRKRIETVALRLFREQGSDKTSLREIAEQLDISKAALYYYFRSKDDLIASLAAPFMDGFRELLEAAENQADDDMSRRLVEGYVDLLFDRRPLVAWLTEDPAVQAHEAIGPVLRSNAQRLRLLLGGTHMSFDEQVRVAAALGALGIGVASFPEVGSDELRGPLLRAAWAVLDK